MYETCNKMATQRKSNTLKDEYWTPNNISLLVDKRIARDAIFKETNSDRLGWLQVAGDMKRDGGSKALNRINVRKQWFKICELYKKSLGVDGEEIRNILINTPYYAKLRQFFEQTNPSSLKSKCMNQEFRKKMTDRIFKISSYADRWTVDRTHALINSRITRHSMFRGRGHAANAWKAITQDVMELDEPNAEVLTVQQVKKKWENIFSKYKAMHQTENYDYRWPHFEKMHHFYTNVYNSEGNKNNNDNFLDEQILENTPVAAADRWPTSRTKLLIERRIARSSMFGRGMSTGGWQAVLNDLKHYGAPADLTIANVKKKWENLLTRFKIIKDQDINSKQSTWPYYIQMEKYHSLKKSRKYKNETYEKVDIEDLLSEEPMELQEIAEDNNSPDLEENTKCRLCQQNNGDYLFTEDKEFCDRIFECTSINVYENIELLPSLICDDCKTTIEKIHEFRSVCHDVNNKLQCSLEQVVIKTENNPDENSTEIQFQDEVATQTLECPECPASFTSSDTLETHIKSHKNSVKFHCEICNAGFIKQSVLFAHIKQHFEMTKLETVEMEDVEVEYLIEENEMDNNDLESVDNTEDCDIDKEIPNELFQCELCSKTFPDAESLKDHFDTHSRIEHHCPRENCNKKFTSLNSLRHHEMRHLGINSFLCTICGKGFVTKNALKMHEKTHAVVKEHVCEICSRGFSVLSNLRTHHRKHHEGHRFYCSQCPKEFLTKSSLERHELVHTGIKEFVCDTCSSAFFTLKELRKHKRYHEGVRLHHCNECFKTFFEKHHLTIHMRRHTGERPYACTIPGCNKSFVDKQKLHRHEKAPHRLTQPD